MADAAPVQLHWRQIADCTAARLAGRPVRLQGWLTAADSHRARIMVAEPPCCPGCLPGSSAARVAVPAAQHLQTGAALLEGILTRRNGAWLLADARPVHHALGRRRLLGSAPLLCLAAAAPDPDPRAVMSAVTTVDVHSHAGRLLDVRSGGPFTPVAEPMRQGGLAVVCLAIVSDAPTHSVMADHRIHPFRQPFTGELYRYGQNSFNRLHHLVQEQHLMVVTDAATLQAASPTRPSVVVAAEGADFLEGDLSRVDEAYDTWRLRHLQLVHYRVNELGDIQTEPPVHGGLTGFGAAVIRRCNQRGIVVDVAHGTIDLVRRAAEVTTKPLVLSHTSLTRNPKPFTRLITPEHAQLVASTGGVVGIWPVADLFPDMAALAGGMAHMAAVVGVDHVALGTDAMGLIGKPTFASYADLPDLAAALLAAGFSGEDTGKILGGNYARVFAASMA